MAIHHHLTGDQAHVQRLRPGEQRIDRLRMHAAEHQRGGGAVAQQLPQKEGRHLVGVLLATVTAFGREGVIV